MRCHLIFRNKKKRKSNKQTNTIHTCAWFLTTGNRYIHSVALIRVTRASTCIHTPAHPWAIYGKQSSHIGPGGNTDMQMNDKNNNKNCGENFENFNGPILLRNSIYFRFQCTLCMCMYRISVVTRPRWNLQWPSSNWIFYLVSFHWFELLFVSDQFLFSTFWLKNPDATETINRMQSIHRCSYFAEFLLRGLYSSL